MSEIFKGLVEKREGETLISMATNAFKVTLKNHLDWYERNDATTCINTIPASLGLFFKSYVL